MLVVIVLVLAVAKEEVVAVLHCVVPAHYLCTVHSWSDLRWCCAGDAILRSEAELQTMLLSNMMLSGGCACIEGLSERLKSEGSQALHPSSPILVTDQPFAFLSSPCPCWLSQWSC